MRQWIAIITVLLIVTAILLVVLLTDRRSSNDRIISDAVFTEFTDSSENQKASTLSGEQTVTNPEGIIKKSDSSTPPTPAMPMQPVTVETNTIPTLLNLSLKNTEGAVIPSAAGTISQNNLHQEFTLGKDGKVLLEELKPGLSEIQIDHPSLFKPAISKTEIHAGTNEYQIIAPQKASLSALLINTKSEPIANAAVAISPVSESQKIKEADLSDRESKEDGRFRFNPLVSGEYVLNVTAPPYLPYEGVVKARIKEETEVIILSEKSQVTVSVLSERSTPIGGAKVMIQSVSKEQGIYMAQQTNDLSGTTIFKNIPAGIYQISAQHGWYVDNGKGRLDYAVKNSSHQVKLVLADRSYIISGKVYDGTTKEPIPNVTVNAYLNIAMDEDPLGRATTDETGNYSIKNLHGGTYEVHANALPKYVNAEFRFDNFNKNPKFAKVITGNEPEIKNVDFALLGAWIVSGKVLQHDGSPVEGADVSALYNYTETGSTKLISVSADNYYGVKTGKDGTYRYIGTDNIFNEQCKVWMVANHDTYKKSELVKITPQPGKEITGIDLIYKEKSLVSGIVVDKQQKPIAGVNVMFWPQPLNISKNITLQTQDDGLFQTMLDSGTYLGRFMKKGYKHYSLDEPLALEAGKKIDPLKITLENGEESFEGWVSEEDGTPIPDISVSFIYVGSGFRNGLNDAITDKEGRFELAADAVHDFEEFLIYVSSSEKYKRAEYRTKEWGAKDIHLVLKRNDAEFANISGAVFDENRQPVTKYQILLIPSQINIRSLWRSYEWRSIYHPDGSFLLEKILITDGPFIIAAKTENAPAVFSDLISLKKDEILENVILILPQSFQVNGQIVNKQGIPISGAIVELIPKIPEGMKFDDEDTQNKFRETQPLAETDNHGFFVLNKVPMQGGTIFAWKAKETKKDQVYDLSNGSLNSKQEVESEKKFTIAPGQPSEQRNLGKIMLEASLSKNKPGN